MVGLAVSALASEAAEDRLRDADLSDWFGPFLPTFVREAVRSGGSAWLAEDSAAPVGLAVTDPVERSASIFSRSAPVVRTLTEAVGTPFVYAEVEPDGPNERFDIYAATTEDRSDHRYRHAVAPIGPGAIAEVGELLAELYGASSERWLAVGWSEGERCFGVRADGRLVGVAWVLVRGSRARLHGLSVRTGYRRIGIGTDLVAARLAFGRSAGARLAFAEIAEGNLASRATAERAGLRPSGRLFLTGAHRSAPVGFAGPAPSGRTATSG